MVLKTTVCRFSGLRIYPGKGILFVRVDGQQFLFLNKKCKSLYNNRLRPAKLAWTVAYRKQHKKDQVSGVLTWLGSAFVAAHSALLHALQSGRGDSVQSGGCGERAVGFGCVLRPVGD